MMRPARPAISAGRAARIRGPGRARPRRPGRPSKHWWSWRSVSPGARVRPRR